MPRKGNLKSLARNELNRILSIPFFDSKQLNIANHESL